VHANPCRETSLKARARTAKLLLGFALIFLVLLGETIVAHRLHPSPASPYVWALLAGGAIVCLVLSAWHHSRSRDS